MRLVDNDDGACVWFPVDADGHVDVSSHHRRVAAKLHLRRRVGFAASLDEGVGDAAILEPLRGLVNELLGVRDEEDLRPRLVEDVDHEMLRHPRLAAANGHDQDDGATTSEPVLLDSGDGLLLVGAEHALDGKMAASAFTGGRHSTYTIRSQVFAYAIGNSA
jgi:hypothetical protein